MSTQTIVQVNKFDAGFVAGLSVTQGPIDEPGAGKIRVRLTLRPINPADGFSLQGVYPGFTPASLPAIPGLEGTGVVDKIGEGCTSSLTVGQRVVSYEWPSQSGNGTWRQYVCVPEENLIAVPDSVTEEQAAMALINPVTVIGMVDILAVPAGEWLLTSAAGSALSRMVKDYAKLSGAKVMGTVRRKEQIAELLADGFDAVVCTADADVADQIKAATGGKGVYGALDSIGGASTKLLSNATRNEGTVIVYGAMEGTSYVGDVMDHLFRLVTIRGYWLVPHLRSLPVAGRRAMMEKVLKLCGEGLFPAYAGTVYDLENVVEAVVEQAKTARGGKVLLRG